MDVLADTQKHIDDYVRDVFAVTFDRRTDLLDNALTPIPAGRMCSEGIYRPPVLGRHKTN
jgi:hypothetical protein